MTLSHRAVENQDVAVLAAGPCHPRNGARRPSENHWDGEAPAVPLIDRFNPDRRRLPQSNPGQHRLGLRAVDALGLVLLSRYEVASQNLRMVAAALMKTSRRRGGPARYCRAVRGS